MDTISKVYHGIRGDDAADLGAKIVVELEAAPAEDVHLPLIKNELKTKSDQLVIAIDRNRVESELDPFDSLRDDTYRSLVYLVRGYKHHLEAEVRNAAEAVNQLFDKYKLELITLNYTAQSTKLESLFIDLEEPSVAANIVLLPSVQGLVDKLKNEQNQFKSAEKRWNDANSISDLQKSATAIKRELIKLFNGKLVVYLRSMMVVNPEPYADLNAKVSNLIDEANALVQRRQNSEGVEAGSN